MLENKMGKSRETIHRLFGYFIAINRARGKNSRVGPIVVRRESREWRGKSFAGKTEKHNFGLQKLSPFLLDRLFLLIARVVIDMTEFPTKTAEKQIGLKSLS